MRSYIYSTWFSYKHLATIWSRTKLLTHLQVHKLCHRVHRQVSISLRWSQSSCKIWNLFAFSRKPFAKHLHKHRLSVRVFTGKVVFHKGWAEVSRVEFEKHLPQKLPLPARERSAHCLFGTKTKTKFACHPFILIRRKRQEEKSLFATI